MTANFLQKRKSQRNLLYIFIGIIIITSLVVWQGFFKEEKVLFSTPSEKTFIENYPEININLGFFENSLLEELQPFIKIEPLADFPPKEEGEKYEGEKGREVPFLPY